MFFLTLSLSVSSQASSFPRIKLLTVNGQTVKTNVDGQKVTVITVDTFAQMSYADARKVLRDLKLKQLSDSLVAAYEIKDSLNMDKISILEKKITFYEERVSNNDWVVRSYVEMVEKDLLIRKKLQDTITEQKRELIKQRRLKTLGFIGCAVLPVTVLITMLSL